MDGKRVLNFCSNNYLGLANHPRLAQAARDAIDAFGIGPAAVRTIAGTMSLHLELERRLAEFKGVEDAVLFQSGYNANLAAIAALVGREDVIFSDELNHASIIDGCRLSRAEVVRYAHCDPEDLRAKVEEVMARPTPPRRGLVVTDGVFSMDGDIAPLPDLVPIAEEHGLMFMVDDAHGEGVLGRGGRGIVDHFGLHGRVDIEVGTLSKAIGVVGGVVAGRRVITEYLRQREPALPLLSAVTVPDTAACLAAVGCSSSEELVKRLWQNTAYLKAGRPAQLRHRRQPDAYCAGDAGRAPLAKSSLGGCSRGCVRHERKPHRAPGQGPHPGNELRRPQPRGSRLRATGVREGGAGAGGGVSQRAASWARAPHH